MIFIFWIKRQTSLRAAQNHGFLLLLAAHFVMLSISIPLSLNCYAFGYVVPTAPVYCPFLNFLQATVYGTSDYLLAIISVQRHMFIFHSHSTSTLETHLVPPSTICVLYCLYDDILYICRCSCCLLYYVRYNSSNSWYGS